MCGIAGIRTFSGAQVDPGMLRQMAELLHHRGPDESSIWTAAGVGFAHTRLSIIDLAASHQPMTSVDNGWTLVFNGEILNYQELRATLDYPFSTDGDTEVIVAGLALQGPDFVKQLRGQFAFAAFEHASDTLHLVRDRLGILPLYYKPEPGRIIFGSETKVVNRAAASPPTVDTASLDAYLTGRSVPAPFTLYSGVRKLRPGHRCEISASGTITEYSYWELPNVNEGGELNDMDVVDAVDIAVRDAVGAALVADVPVGSYLSGGVDSSLIVAVMKQLRGGAVVETFAAGFGDPRHDELAWARLVSERIGTTHHEVQVSARDFEELWPKLTWHRDAPVSEPADMAVFRLAEEARRHVAVVLSGEGGDELFGGYPKYRFARWSQLARVVPRPIRRSVAKLIDPRLSSRMARGRIALRVFGAPSELDQLRTWFAPFTAAERAVLLGSATTPSRAPVLPEGVDPVDRMLRFDIAGWLPDNLLERGDRMSMASSLELRPPMLDHKLVELAFGLPSRFKVRGGTTKWALKEVARRYLPSEVVDRRKVGFKVPLDAWFRAGLRDLMWDRLNGASSFVGSSFDSKLVRQILIRHERGDSNEESRIWTLMSLEVWHSVCVLGNTD